MGTPPEPAPTKGEEVWRFVATGEGTTGLAFSYVGPSGDTTGEPFTVTVEVAS